MLQQLPL